MNTRRIQRTGSPLHAPLTEHTLPRIHAAMTGNSNNSDDGFAPTRAVSLCTPISAPILRSVDPVQIARFLKERERYELEIAAKQSDLPSLSVLPYNASIDRSLLKNLFFMGKFDHIADGIDRAAEVTDEHIKAYITSLVKHATGADPNLAIIEKAVESFAMSPHIADADARITHFCADFFERLEGVGCCDFREVNPKKPSRSCSIVLLRPPQARDAQAHFIQRGPGKEHQKVHQGAVARSRELPSLFKRNQRSAEEDIEQAKRHVF